MNFFFAFLCQRCREVRREVLVKSSEWHVFQGLDVRIGKFHELSRQKRREKRTRKKISRTSTGSPLNMFIGGKSPVQRDFVSFPGNHMDPEKGEILKNALHPVPVQRSNWPEQKISAEAWKKPDFRPRCKPQALTTT